MTASEPEEWTPVAALPVRPLLIAELPDVASRFDSETIIWIEINADKTKRAFGLADVGEELIIHFAAITDNGAHQYRFDEDHWVTKGPIPKDPGLSTVESETDGDWMCFKNLEKRIRAATTIGDTITAKTEVNQSASDVSRTTLLPPHFATLSDLTRLKTFAKEAYGGKVTVWIETGLMEFYEEHADITDLGRTRVRCIAVETADAYYRFEFDLIDQTWRETGPIDPAAWEYEPPGDSEFIALEQFTVDGAGDFYWWTAHRTAREVTVAIADLDPYSKLHIAPPEKRTILDAVNERLDRLSDEHAENDPMYESITSLRATVQQVSSTLRLSVEEHDRLKTVLRTSSAEAPLRRLQRAEPECDVGCDKTGYQRIQIDDGDIYTVCNDCKAAIVSSGDRVPVLRQLDPRITSDHDVRIERVEKSEVNPIQQSELDDFY